MGGYAAARDTARARAVVGLVSGVLGIAIPLVLNVLIGPIDQTARHRARPRGSATTHGGTAVPAAAATLKSRPGETEPRKFAKVSSAKFSKCETTPPNAPQHTPSMVRAEDWPSPAARLGGLPVAACGIALVVPALIHAATVLTPIAALALLRPAIIIPTQKLLFVLGHLYEVATGNLVPLVGAAWITVAVGLLWIGRATSWFRAAQVEPGLVQSDMAAIDRHR